MGTATPRRHERARYALPVLLSAALLASCATTPAATAPPAAVELPELARQVEIRRTQHGVPHILAENLRAAAFALAWVQLEDHGPRIIEGMNAARGRAALVRGEALVDADARARLRRDRAEVVFALLGQDTRDVYAGFAAGMNHFIRVHRQVLPDWTAAEPVTTPRGLASAARAAEAFAWAVEETRRQFGSWDVAWGEVHRVRRGSVDVPVGGCSGALGCFRVLNFSTAADGRRVVDGGDGWVLAVEFGEEPRAYSVLAYGQSPDPRSPWHADQAALFAANRMKPVLWTEQEIEAGTVVRYRPGERPAGARGPGLLPH
jgi:acyl-homoserine lactone acylase PvdQ